MSQYFMNFQQNQERTEYWTKFSIADWLYWCDKICIILLAGCYDFVWKFEWVLENSSNHSTSSTDTIKLLDSEGFVLGAGDTTGNKKE